jgi:hypothetical protein
MRTRLCMFEVQSCVEVCLVVRVEIEGPFYAVVGVESETPSQLIN